MHLTDKIIDNHATIQNGIENCKDIQTTNIQLISIQDTKPNRKKKSSQTSFCITSSQDPVGTVIGTEFPEECQHQYQSDFERRLYNREIKIIESKKGCGSFHSKINKYDVTTLFTKRCKLENHNDDPKCISSRIYSKFDLPLRRYLTPNEFANIDYSNITIKIEPHPEYRLLSDRKGTVCRIAQTREEYDGQYKRVRQIESEYRAAQSQSLIFWGSTSIFTISPTFSTEQDLNQKLLQEAKKEYPHLNTLQYSLIVNMKKRDIANDNIDKIKALALDFVCWDVTNAQLSYMKDKGYHRLCVVNMKKQWKSSRKIACGVNTKNSSEIYALRTEEKKLSDEEVKEIQNNPIQYKLHYFDVMDENVKYAIDDPTNPGRIVNIREFVNIVEWENGNPFLSSWFAYFGTGLESRKLLYNFKIRFK